VLVLHSSDERCHTAVGWSCVLGFVEMCEDGIYPVCLDRCLDRSDVHCSASLAIHAMTSY
jgi:hypothetical protein